MESEFCEIQFAFSCTNELSKIQGFGFPFFFTAKEEKEFGPDVVFYSGLYAPVFLQYKVPKFVEKNVFNTKKYWDLFNGPYYYFKIYPKNRSPQHNKLIDLSLTMPFVFYCSPIFVKYDNYIELSQKKLVAESSAFIPCKDLPKNVGYDVHKIYYPSDMPYCYWMSEPNKHEMILGSKHLKEYCLSRSKPEHFKEIDEIIIQLSDIFKIDIANYLSESQIFKKLVEDVISKYGITIGLLVDMVNKAGMK